MIFYRQDEAVSGSLQVFHSAKKSRSCRRTSLHPFDCTWPFRPCDNRPTIVAGRGCPRIHTFTSQRYTAHARRTTTKDAFLLLLSIAVLPFGGLCLPLGKTDERQGRVLHVEQLLVQGVNALRDGRGQQAGSFQKGEGVFVARAPHHRVHLARATE